MESQTPAADARLDHLDALERRLAQVVGELEARLTGWNDVETRLHRDASWRFQALERAIENEWAAIRHMHEEPARQLRTHADNLTEICVATAGSAQTGLERAEARLATLERDLHRRMDELSRELHGLVAELRHRTDGAPIGNPASSWSLDEVTRLHQELRQGSAPRAGLPPAPSADGSERSSTIEAPLATGETVAVVDESAHARVNLRWYAAVAVLALALGISIVFTLSSYRRADSAAARATEAQQHAEQIATAADHRIEQARQDAAEKIAQARETASKAQVTGDVLAAPDLVRFNLTGGEPEARFSAQLLWSRSRGMVFSASRLPAPPHGSTYQIWLLTAGAPVSAGTFLPDSSGRVTASTDTPPNVPRPLTGVRVTLEPEPGRPEPSGAIVLARAQ